MSAGIKDLLYNPKSPNFQRDLLDSLSIHLEQLSDRFKRFETSRGWSLKAIRQEQDGTFDYALSTARLLSDVFAQNEAVLESLDDAGKLNLQKHYIEVFCRIPNDRFRSTVDGESKTNAEGNKAEELAKTILKIVLFLNPSQCLTDWTAQFIPKFLERKNYTNESILKLVLSPFVHSYSESKAKEIIDLVDAVKGEYCRNSFVRLFIELLLSHNKSCNGLETIIDKYWEKLDIYSRMTLITQDEKWKEEKYVDQVKKALNEGNRPLSCDKIENVINRACQVKRDVPVILLLIDWFIEGGFVVEKPGLFFSLPEFPMEKKVDVVYNYFESNRPLVKNLIASVKDANNICAGVLERLLNEGKFKEAEDFFLLVKDRVDVSRYGDFLLSRYITLWSGLIKEEELLGRFVVLCQNKILNEGLVRGMVSHLYQEEKMEELLKILEVEEYKPIVNQLPLDFLIQAVRLLLISNHNVPNSNNME